MIERSFILQTLCLVEWYSNNYSEECGSYWISR